jgi:hypothetical protein
MINMTLCKATSDTIWDWKIQDQMIWVKVLKQLAAKENEVGVGSSWWSKTYIQRTVSKMSIKLYFLEQKQKWQDEYRFKCADNTYKYVPTEAFY